MQQAFKAIGKMNQKRIKNCQNIKVLMLTTSFPVTKNSISGIFIHHLVTHFPGDIEVNVLVPGSTYKINPYINDNYKLTCYRYAPLSWQILTHQPGGLPAALEKNSGFIFLLPIFFLSMLVSCIRLSRHADIIHANWGINGAVAGMAGYITKKPVVTTLRGTDVKRIQHSLIDRLLLRLCFAANKKIICVSRAIHEFILKNFPGWAEKFVTIPNGIGHEFLNIKSGRQAGTGIKLTSIGSLTVQKGIKTIIQAVGKIKNNNIHFTVIGDGPEKQVLENQVSRLGLSDQVNFPGQVLHQEIHKYLENTDIFILASFSEGRPNAVLEAMAAGVPVIASDIDGVRELISNEKNGLLFEPGNSGQLAEQIEKLQNDPELRHRLGQAGRNFIIQNGLSWENTAYQYAKLYKEVIKCAD
ncbi:Glycosyl transferase, family I [Desulfonema limicola]|uniref:Glycosyl transferase, family I n=1 Tax=Desulfonema limicola TaxID=45656 RepID=A0A975BAQ8_9BACT|nr:glycosyltransferase family 4 protein [Desulfonema limicola]QTA81903.1 Glycosyl transferase, family I [Desulfonema limicola]